MKGNDDNLYEVVEITMRGKKVRKWRKLKKFRMRKTSSIRKTAIQRAEERMAKRMADKELFRNEIKNIREVRDKQIINKYTRLLEEYKRLKDDKDIISHPSHYLFDPTIRARIDSEIKHLSDKLSVWNDPEIDSDASYYTDKMLEMNKSSFNQFPVSAERKYHSQEFRPGVQTTSSHVNQFPVSPSIKIPLLDDTRVNYYQHPQPGVQTTSSHTAAAVWNQRNRNMRGDGRGGHGL